VIEEYESETVLRGISEGSQQG